MAVALANRIDLRTIPISAIHTECLQCLSRELNKKKILKTDDGLDRDWRGVLKCINLPNAIVEQFDGFNDPFAKVMTEWVRFKPEQATIGILQDILERIDRFDVFDDTELDMIRYAHEFNESHWIRRQGLEMRSPPAEQNSDDGLDDHYNVFLLYDEDIAADRSFAMEIFDNLVERGLKIFDAELDLRGGSFKNRELMNTIAERSERVLAVISPDFFKSNSKQFLVNYAQSISIEQCYRKVITCTHKIYRNGRYERWQLPTNLSYLHTLYYDPEQLERRGDNFYKRLVDSLKPVPRRYSNHVMIQEYETSIRTADVYGGINPPGQLAIQAAPNRVNSILVPAAPLPQKVQSPTLRKIPQGTQSEQVLARLPPAAMLSQNHPDSISTQHFSALKTSKYHDADRTKALLDGMPSTSKLESKSTTGENPSSSSIEPTGNKKKKWIFKYFSSSKKSKE